MGISTVEAVISEELFVSASVYMVRYLARATAFEGHAVVTSGGVTVTIPLSDAVLMFSPGGCAVIGGNCWYAFGLLDLSYFQRDATAVVSSVSVVARTEVGDIGIAVDELSVEVVGGSIYRVELYASVTAPQKGLVRIIRPR